MADLEDHGIDNRTLQKTFDEWKSGGSSKSELGPHYPGKTESDGKVFSSLVRRYLGKQTEKTHPLVAENIRLQRVVERLQAENEQLGRER